MNISVIIVIIATFLGAVGQVLFKKISSKNFKEMLKDIKLYLALLLYVFATIMFIGALKFEKLTILYPLASLNYIWAGLLAMKFLKEKMNYFKWGGILLIIAGVILVIK